MIYFKMVEDSEEDGRSSKKLSGRGRSPSGLKVTSSLAGLQGDGVSPVLKAAVVIIFCFLVSAGNLLITATKVDGYVPYIFITVTLFAEIGKFVTASLLGFVQTGSIPKRFWNESGYYAIPALLYTFDNNLVYVILRYMDAATLAVLWNLKILVTAVLFRLVLKRSLSVLQWNAVVLLLLGVVTSEAEKAKSSVGGHSGEDGEGSSPDANADRAKFLIGVLLVLIGVTVTSAAGVYSEWILKRRSSDNFFLQNMQMYMYGVIFNTIALFLHDYERVKEEGLLVGYTWVTWLLVFVQATSGLSVAFIFKFLDNIVGVYAHAASMFITMFISIIFFQFAVTLEFVCGLSVCSISIYLYHFKPVPAPLPSSSSEYTHASHQYAAVCAEGEDIENGMELYGQDGIELAVLSDHEE